MILNLGVVPNSTEILLNEIPMSQTVTPYNTAEGKKKQVADMFDNIAGKYDFLNHFLSLNIDKIWRKKGIKILQKEQPKRILDIATGTGDLAIATAKRIHPEQIIGIDISVGMITEGQKKIQKLGLQDIITLQEGDSEDIQFDTDSFDAVTVAFGVRNFEHLEKGLSEIKRVLKPGGKFMILEFSQPENWFMKTMYNFYFTKILPLIGRMVSKDTNAYTYLPESVKHFPYGDTMDDILQNTGFKNTAYKTLFGGIATIYHGEA